MVTEAGRRYHHGDLRAALLTEGYELAREAGPSAVLLRDAARRAGVSHNAGYRHFTHRADYLAAVAARCMAALAVAMERALSAVAAGDDGADRAETARRRLIALGRAYVEFARAEPGLFRTAFSGVGTGHASSQGDSRGPAGLSPYELLVQALDDLAAAGVLPPERRQHSEMLAWSAVHGLADLLVDGPLRGAPDDDVDAMWARVGSGVLRGL